MYFDTHAHYDSSKFDADRDAVLRALPESGVTLVVDPGDNAERSRRAVELAQQYPHVYAAVGWHPEEAENWDENSLPAIRELAKQPKVCAIGEIGLDYYWDTTYRERQKEMFRAQIELALELDLPVIVHDREAHGDSLEIVRDYPALRGVFHCFSGSVEMAQELLRRGWYLGFDGPITYKNAARAPEVIRICPMERILLETDSPYLAPVPNRGKRNDSRNLPYIAATVARIKDMPVEAVAAQTMENGKKLFGIR
ncbi:MAG: TatD family hydrolase [Clostridiales bacterium]|nr:TatD family hydrolase [Clostridiales bacterium]MDD6935853.1 TatD family hydrolase [Clostridiales bacterium]MDY2961628.1 TatD family hydrolase [Oscillospiraceae bacterium]